MPSLPLYLKRRHVEFLDTVADDRDGVENPSQALQEVLDEYMETDA